MLKIFFEYMEEFILFYVDNLLIYSETEEEHLRHIKLVFQKFREAGLKLKLLKCSFFKSQIKYLGHLISHKGIKPLPDKVQAIVNLKPPENITQTKHILGLIAYYCQFFPVLSEIIRPINMITRKNIPHVWTSLCHNSLHCIKDFITSSPILRHPDPNLPYILYTDCSKYTWFRNKPWNYPMVPNKRWKSRYCSSQGLILKLRNGGLLSKRKIMLSMLASRKWYST